jgi:rhomboid protease GluP
MPTDPVAAPLPVGSTHAVDFNPYVAGNYNRDLGGKGTLTIVTEEPRYRFTGRPRRGLLMGKQDIEVRLASSEIWNAIQHDTAIEFSTSVGKSGAKGTPFVFTCTSAEEAATILARLPSTKDKDLVAGEDFVVKLRALRDSGTGFASVTNLLILTCAAVFVAMGFAGAGWFEVADTRPYVIYGANNAIFTTNGQWWRLVSCMFLHYGLIHLLLNVWALYEAGHLIERLLGRTLYVILYFGSGILASLSTLHWSGDKVWSAGASGAVFGVFGAMLGYFLRERKRVPQRIFRPLVNSTLWFAGYNLLYGASRSGIDNAAHVGGLLSGFILGWLSALPVEPALREQKRAGRITSALTFTFVAVMVAILTLPKFPPP